MIDEQGQSTLGHTSETDMTLYSVLALEMCRSAKVNASMMRRGDSEELRR